MKSVRISTVTVIVASFFATSTSLAISPFKKAFDAKYVKASGVEEYKATFKKTGCYTCHVKGKKKDTVNAFGFELAKLIKGNVKDRLDAAKEDGSDAKKAEEKVLLKELEAVWKKVEAKKAPTGETYAELFKAHRLPTAEGAKSVPE